MGKLSRRYLLTALLFLGYAAIGLADAPPDPGGDPGTGGGTPVGGGTPIGSGLIITMTLAAAYSARKTFNIKEGV